MLVLTTLATSVLLLSAANAQNQSPVVKRGPPAFLSLASAAAKDAIFYHGGQLNTQQTTYTNELWSLDVTASWPISDPAWTNLTVEGAPRVAEHSATMSKDFSTLMVTNPAGDSSPFLYIYNLKSKVWSNAPAPAAQAAQWASRKDVYFVTDTNQGNAWMIGGIQAGNQPTNSVDKFDPSSGQWSANVIPPSATPQLDPYSTGTSHYYNGKIYIFGGYDSRAGTRGYQSFQRLPRIDVTMDPPVVGDQYTMGEVPPSPSSDKVIIFGGSDVNTQATLSDMWVLDLPTFTWKRVIPKLQPKPRRQHACHIVGANLIVFGGAGVNSTGYNNDVQVYDVMQSTWVESYAPKQDTTPRSPPHSNGPNTGSSGGISTGAIIGIVAGVVVLAFVVFSIVFFKRRQRRIEIREAELEKEAYLASLRPEPAAAGGGGGGAPHSPADSRIAFTNKDMGSPIYYTDGAGSPMPAATPGVQYLMQQLPDGTIAVQPVYVDASALSPPPAATPASTDADAAGYISPSAILGSPAPGSVGSPKGGYMSPPGTGMATGSGSTAGANAGGYPVPYPQPVHYAPETSQSQDPFASPVLANAYAQPSSAAPSPRPPAPASVGSPQQIHHDAHYTQQR
ncbi:hypothetical protein DFQ27_005174 [Actinomortierella ambigua]|uniref:Galactose oxidase n=1 Tax=Actinomortierella ambigua TaxID=1343610 RepID=A0A9P6PZS1_9FUNG|nr:hypothetical protein DFQ27_005174 [Actinomortierella ambigua]